MWPFLPLPGSMVYFPSMLHLSAECTTDVTTHVKAEWPRFRACVAVCAYFATNIWLFAAKPVLRHYVVSRVYSGRHVESMDKLENLGPSSPHDSKFDFLLTHYDEYMARSIPPKFRGVPGVVGFCATVSPTTLGTSLGKVYATPPPL